MPSWQEYRQRPVCCELQLPHSPAAASCPAASPPPLTLAGVSVLIASRSAWRVMTMMLMRRLMGLRGSARSNSTDEDRPTTLAVLSVDRPAASRARRAALARSLDKSQLVRPLAPA